MSGKLTAADLKARISAVVRPAPTSVDTKSFGTVFIREFTGKEMDYLLNRPDGMQRTEFVTRSLCDEDGEPLLDGDVPENVELIGSMPNPELQRIFEKVREINGLSKGEAGPTHAS